MSEPYPNSETDARCAECIDMGVECPSGYETDRWVCGVCTAGPYIVVRARCFVFGPPVCPKCSAFLDTDEPDDEEEE